ncbi:MAG: hypothetical protein J7619_10195 [Dyadobacter sp.]|uniref:hypothetical protein n=1 Tax=Dyadobacter sp. TaxID=1914288 RepID=UPI001B26BA38|nr:hypothetical protein [Dyadobacter sp.]MBO9613055.1 hypothetical protein [Dyadobacter sp.]
MRPDKSLFFSLFICLSIGAKAQIRFEKGYFVNNDKVKTVCNIRNVDWDNNPSSFRYQLPGSDEVLDAALQDVSAFGIDGGNAYVRALVKVDQSSTDVSRLSNDRNPEWQEQLVFLKVLVEGEATLFQYKRNEVSQFYYQKGDSLYTPLVFKRYIDGNGQRAINFGFRQQLLNELSCEGITQLQIERTSYRESDLVSYFQRYNTCKRPGGQDGVKKVRRNIFNVKITPGVDMSQLSTSGFTRTRDGKNKGNTTGIRAGAEVEYFAPFHKNKWSIFVEPSFQAHKFPLRVTSTDVDMNFWTIEVPVGIRHHFYLSEKTKVFVNVFYSRKIKESAMVEKDDHTDYRVIANSGFGGGAGVAYGPFSLEARYYLKRALYAYRVRIDMEYSKATVILGYRLFKK